MGNTNLFIHFLSSLAEDFISQMNTRASCFLVSLFCSIWLVCFILLTNGRANKEKQQNSSISVFTVSSKLKSKNRLQKEKPIVKDGTYIWEGNRYERLCERILERTQDNDDYLDIAYRFQYGGFGNQLYTFVATSLASIASSRRYRCMNYQFYKQLVIYDYYDTIFDGCYKKSMITQKKFNIISSKYTNCVPYGKCFNTRDKYWNVEAVLGDKNATISAALMKYDKILSNPEYFHIWKDVFGYDGKSGLWNVRRDLLHLILNPEESLRNELLQEKAKIVKKPFMIGLQLRMGGKMSDTPEEYVGIPLSRLSDIITQVDTLVKNRNVMTKDVTIYVSSDSTLAVKEIKRLTNKKYEVIESKLYKHGHTSSYTMSMTKEYTVIMRKVASDFYYMSICDYVFVSWPSSMGRMMCAMQEEANCGAVLNWKNENKKVPIPE